MTLQTLLLFALTIGSGTLMGTAQKFLAGYSPLLVNAVAQGCAAIIFLLLYVWFQRGSDVGGGFHRAMIVLGLAFIGLNYGYSTLYGHGVALAYVPILVTGGMTILLGIVGWRWFGETISWQFIIGALMVLAGMGVMVYR